MTNADDFVSPAPEPSDAERRSVSALAKQLLAAEDLVEEREAALAEAEKALALLRDELLPKAMLDIGQDQLTLTGGFKVSVKDAYVCGQLDDAPDDPDKKDRRPYAERFAALEWLDASGQGDIARRVVSVTLGAKSSEVATALITLLRSSPYGNNLKIDHRRLVPWNTLSGFVRERDGAGALDAEDFKRLGVSKLRRAKISRPKKGASEF